MEKIPVIYGDDFLTDYRTMDCENPERVTEIYYSIRKFVDFIEPEPCTTSDLLLCHSDRLVATVEQNAEVFRVAKKAVGGAIRAAVIALQTPSFGLIRPPGHHAGRNFNGGFCFFNNMAIALSCLLSKGIIQSALIIDIDLHYGNGTYDIVKDDDRISFRNIDSREKPQFFADLELALRDASWFDIVGCSAGFDTYVRDWGGLLFTDDYRKIASLIVSSNPRTFTILEGGYYIPDLGKNVLSYLKGIQEACLP
ncbi:MAG: Acetylpolyamine aminohydrolase [Syntrophorhabdus sp. PtaU1.Bin050]|nr:MAG: Acetylpolyamine aminohydrolase [Syntrophorhabdus sp. PtaU1.Bin050]